MKKVLIITGAVVGVAVLGLFGAAMMQPDEIHVERSVVVDATPTDMAPFAEDLARVNEWSPWEKRDPSMKKTYSEKTDGVGATYEWNGNENVGSGRQTITSIEPGKVVHKLEFFEPFQSVADASILYEREGKDLKVTWAYDQDADLMTKVMLLFVDMDAALGPDFEEGLALLKPVVESAAAERRAAERQAKKEAEAAEAAAAAEVAEAGGEGEGDAEGGEPGAEGDAQPSDDGDADPA